MRLGDVASFPKTIRGLSQIFYVPKFSTRFAVLILLDLDVTFLFFDVYRSLTFPHICPKFYQIPLLSCNLPPSFGPLMSCDGRVGVAVVSANAESGTAADRRGRHRCLLCECPASGGGRWRCIYFRLFCYLTGFRSALFGVWRLFPVIRLAIGGDCDDDMLLLLSHW